MVRLLALYVLERDTLKNSDGQREKKDLLLKLTDVLYCLLHTAC